MDLDGMGRLLFLHWAYLINPWFNLISYVWTDLTRLPLPTQSRDDLNLVRLGLVNPGALPVEGASCPK